jgi:hypothetical protein
VARETRQRVWWTFGELSGRQPEVFVRGRLGGWFTVGVKNALGMRTAWVERHLFHSIRHPRAAAISGSV